MIQESELKVLGDELFPHNPAARFKLEFYCSLRTSGTKAFGGILKVWTGGSAVGGNADTSVYLCPKCWRPIMPSALAYYDTKDGIPVKPYYGAVCTQCSTMMLGEDLVDMRYAYLPLEPGWLDLLEWYYAILGNDVDLYLKRWKSEFHPAFQARLERPGSFYAIKDYLKMVVDKELVMYPFHRMIKDTQITSLRSALKGLLKS